MKNAINSIIRGNKKPRQISKPIVMGERFMYKNEWCEVTGWRTAKGKTVVYMRTELGIDFTLSRSQFNSL